MFEWYCAYRRGLLKSCSVQGHMKSDYEVILWIVIF